MEDIMEDNFEKLNLLLEQEQCEFVDIPDGFTGQTESGELRLIYLMNDAVESLEQGNQTTSSFILKRLPGQVRCFGCSKWRAAALL